MVNIANLTRLVDLVSLVLVAMKGARPQNDREVSRPVARPMTASLIGRPNGQGSLPAMPTFSLMRVNVTYDTGAARNAAGAVNSKGTVAQPAALSPGIASMTSTVTVMHADHAANMYPDAALNKPANAATDAVTSAAPLAPSTAPMFRSFEYGISTAVSDGRR
jgi:hypothetical protein